MNANYIKNILNIKKNKFVCYFVLWKIEKQIIY